MFGRGGVVWIVLALLTVTSLSGVHADAGDACSVGSHAAFCEPKDKAKGKAKEEKPNSASRPMRNARC